MKRVVESFAFAHRPYEDPAKVPGQNPDVGNRSDQISFRALREANDSAFSEHKLNGECGKVGQ